MPSAHQSSQKQLIFSHALLCRTQKHPWLANIRWQLSTNICKVLKYQTLKIKETRGFEIIELVQSGRDDADRKGRCYRMRQRLCTCMDSIGLIPEPAAIACGSGVFISGFEIKLFPIIVFFASVITIFPTHCCSMLRLLQRLDENTAVGRVDSSELSFQAPSTRCRYLPLQ